MQFLRFREAVVAAVLDRAGEVVDAGQGGQVAGAELGFAEGEDLSVNVLGLGVAALLGGDEGDFVHADEGFDVRGAQGLFADGKGAAVLLFGFGVSIEAVRLRVEIRKCIKIIGYSIAETVDGT